MVNEIDSVMSTLFSSRNVSKTTQNLTKRFLRNFEKFNNLREKLNFYCRVILSLGENSRQNPLLPLHRTQYTRSHLTQIAIRLQGTCINFDVRKPNCAGSQVALRALPSTTL